MTSQGFHDAAAPLVERVRMQPVRRSLAVRDINYITPRMVRITLEGAELAGFVSPAPDDHIKLFFPSANGEREMRDYTPRRYNIADQTLEIDFALHESGVATDWAVQAKPGDRLRIGGPRGSNVISVAGAWWFLIGDETALPAIGRRIEEFPAGTQVISLVAVTDSQEEQVFETKAEHTALWVHRPAEQAAEAVSLLQGLAAIELPAGPGFIWIAAEAGVSRELRGYVTEMLGHPEAWLKASGYWSKASADANK